MRRLARQHRIPRAGSANLARFVNWSSRSPRRPGSVTRASSGSFRNWGSKGSVARRYETFSRKKASSLDRTSDSWENFVQRHGETLWACDFFSVKTITARGIRNVNLLVFLCMKTRKVIVSSSTARPNSRWVVKQTEMFIDRTKDRKEKPSIVMHDRDTKFTKQFVATLRNGSAITSRSAVM